MEISWWPVMLSKSQNKQGRNTFRLGGCAACLGRRVRLEEPKPVKVP